MPETPSDRPDAPAPADCWRVSSGSAAVLGLCDLRLDAAPTTAYLMLGGRCQRGCAFCAQARGSTASADALSRVTWPPYAAERVADAVAAGYAAGRIARACFQVTHSAGHLALAERTVAALAARTSAPICVSVAPRSEDDVARLLAAGAQRVTIALDGATQEVYRRIKDGSWARTLGLLEACAQCFPGRIGTHLIVGLGESERDMAMRLQQMADWGVTAGLFAFTPVRGTPLADHPAPELAHYRRVQAARWLITRGLARAEQMGYDGSGRLTGYGLEHDTLRQLLADGGAFRTSGCADCNRPYYNERPGGVLYNYPRPLAPAEAQAELSALLASLQ
ncbi:MAG: radical SAM protein [Chloroflexota bacterium]